MKISFPFLALLCVSVTLGAEANLVRSHARQQAGGLLRVSAIAPAPAAPTDDARDLQAGARPWWQGFQDEALDTLITAAQQHAAASGARGRATATVRLMGDNLQLPLDMQVASAYITARVDQLSLMLIAEARRSYAREDALLATQIRQPASFADAGRSALQRRMAAAESAERSHAARRNESLALLATLSGLPPDDLMARIGPALSNESLPRFVAPVPHLLPAALLLQRDDVALVSALDHLDPDTLLQGWIEPEQAAEKSTEAGDETGDAAQQVVARARHEVAQAMAEVDHRNQLAASMFERAAASRQAVERMPSDPTQNAASQLEFLENYQRLMLHSQQLTSASADLALTWIKLIYRLGGAGTLNENLRGTDNPAAAALPSPPTGRTALPRRPPPLV